MRKRQEFHYSTYARAILSDLKSLADLIRKYSLPSKEKTKSAFQFSSLLTLQQIEEALLNPQSTIKPTMVAFANLLKLHLEVLEAIEQSQKQRKATQDTIQALRDQFTEVADAEKEELLESLTALEESHKLISQTHAHLVALEPQIRGFKKQVVELTQVHDQAWEDYRRHHLSEIADDLAASGVELSEIEKKELLDQETWPEIIRRFQTLGLPIPAYLKLDKPNFTTYFKLKAYLTTHASLSRRMLPHKPDDIVKILKKILHI